MSGASSVTVAAAGPPFTVAQWQELEHQALIFKYLKAGLPVPPYLLLPMRKNFHQPSTLPYCSYFGKKIDPEPGRCRRTDGKKWRCSKNAHPDSKYCERHMNRTRNRSRKPVESQTTSQSASATGSSSESTSCTTFLNLPQPSVSNSETLRFGNNVSRWQMDSGPYGDRPKEYRFLHGGKPEADEQKFLPGSLVGARSVGMSSNVSDTWQHASRIPSNSSAEPRNGTLLQNSYSQVQMLQGFEPLPVDAMLKQRQQRYESGSVFGSSESGKLESQSLQRLCDDWPKCRDLDSNLMDQRSYKTSSTVQLSMGIPMGSSPHNDFPSFNGTSSSLEQVFGSSSHL